MYDIIIIGGGPAGLTAALYAGRAGKQALVIEKNVFGGQMTFSPKIENYPGVPAGAGMEIADAMVEQVLSQGIDTEFDTVVGLAKNADGTFTVKGEFAEYVGKSVIVAVGCKHRRLGLKGEDELIGDGISFCAICDGAFYKDQSVIMVGGGNSALQEAILLSETSTKVTIVQNLPYFTGEAKLIEQVGKRENIEVIFSAVAESLIVEDGKFKGLNIKTDAGEIKPIYADGMFVAIGLQPENEPFAELAQLNSYGYFDTDESCVTGTDGLFVAGDCRSKRIRQVTTATADGAVAALAACRYLDN